jgi:coenzyme F420-reducing hydrogenase delta subunit
MKGTVQQEVDQGCRYSPVDLRGMSRLCHGTQVHVFSSVCDGPVNVQIVQYF